jgi:hypothetical protein
MNYLFKLALALIGATSFSTTIAVIVIFILGWVVNAFKLNYGRDAYWVFNIAFGALIFSWIIIFAYLMTAIPEKEKLTPKEPPASTKEDSVKCKEPIEIPNVSFEEHAKNCQQCGRPEITEDGPQSLCEEGFRIFQREIIQKMEKKK